MFKGNVRKNHYYLVCNRTRLVFPRMARGWTVAMPQNRTTYKIQLPTIGRYNLRQRTDTLVAYISQALVAAL